MKKIIFLALMMSATNAIAMWAPIKSQIDIADSKSDIAKLKAQYGQELRYLSSADWFFMVHLEVNHTVYSWVGPSKCPAGSGNLSLTAVSYSYSLAGPFGTFAEAVNDPYAEQIMQEAPCSNWP